MLLRILLILMIINVVALMVVDENKVHLKKALKGIFWILLSGFSITISIYHIFPDEKLADEFFRSGAAYRDNEPAKILIDKYEIVSLSDTELTNSLTKRKTPYILEIHELNPDHILRIKSIIKTSKYIESIKISRLSEKSAESLYTAFDGNNSITSIFLYNCSECIRGMNDKLKWPNNIRKLSIEHTQIDVPSAESITFPDNIEELSIEKCGLNTNYIKLITPKLPKGLKRVTFSHNRLTSTSIDILIPWLLENKDLKYLDISYNKITDTGLTKVIDALVPIETVKEIILNKNASTNSFDGKLKHYREIVKNEDN